MHCARGLKLAIFVAILVACACVGYVTGTGEYEYLLGDRPPDLDPPESPAAAETLIVRPDTLTQDEFHLWEEVKSIYGTR